MCTACTISYDQATANAFSEKMLGHLNGAALMLMTSIGHRTRLFDAMFDGEPHTTNDLAARCGLSERYVREWLGAVTTGGITRYDPESSTYSLPPEHAAWLTRSASPNNMAVSAQWIGVLGSAEDAVTDAFRHGEGVPYSAYGRFHEVMAEESNQTTLGGIDEHILPLVPQLEALLENGIRVADVGCGRGKAMLHLASRFPRSRFVGIDLSHEAVADATARAAQEGLTNVRFEARDLTTWDSEDAFDVITAFDAIHDQPRPDLVLRNIVRALRTDGIFLMQDIRASSHLERNLDHPMGPFIYTISCMHCMSVSLAQGGMGLGAAWGEEKARQMLAEAGLRSVQVEQLPHDILNSYYVCRR